MFPTCFKPFLSYPNSKPPKHHNCIIQTYTYTHGYIYISGRKKSVIVLNNGKNVFPEEIETLLNKVEGIKESFVYEKKEDGDVKVCVKIVYDKEIIKELYNIEGEDEIREFLWGKVKDVNRLMPKYKYVREMIITEEELIKTTTLKIKRHEEIKKIFE